mmetsp:Transcript_14430/g.31256  ORF Transcript_14430/g.31256 Transcript_14430/m.31256 type:complete len:254 (+) Transcript_14430:265-1026(+)
MLVESSGTSVPPPPPPPSPPPPVSMTSAAGATAAATSGSAEPCATGDGTCCWASSSFPKPAPVSLLKEGSKVCISTSPLAPSMALEGAAIEFRGTTGDIDILEAAEAIAGKRLLRTPLPRAEEVSPMTGAKMDCLNCWWALDFRAPPFCRASPACHSEIFSSRFSGVHWRLRKRAWRSCSSDVTRSNSALTASTMIPTGIEKTAIPKRTYKMQSLDPIQEKSTLAHSPVRKMQVQYIVSGMLLMLSCSPHSFS